MIGILKRGLLFPILLMCGILFSNTAAIASHMIGGDISYKCLGNNMFEITLTLYQDCLNGEPTAIASDDPANYAIFKNGTFTSFYAAGNVQSVSTDIIPTGFTNECITNYPNTCLRRQVFVFEQSLPPSPDGYSIVYQRCCRNNVIANLANPGNVGVTYYATIPPFADGECPNNSAVFKSLPPQIICNNNPFEYDFSATDADGDSLSYELCAAYPGGSTDQPNPTGNLMSPPPYGSIQYLPPYSAGSPMSGFPPLQINPITGLLTITPNAAGRFVVTVCVNEWRNGVIINTLRRDVQFVVTNCSKTVVANIPQFSQLPNTYYVQCSSNEIHFVNTSTGGFSYLWDFGDGSTSTEQEPTHIYADTGIYAVKLIVNQGSTCLDSITRLVRIYPQFNTDFVVTDKHCPGDSLQFTDLSLATFPPLSTWNWEFGDNTFSDVQNPIHVYAQGGDYSVRLITTTEKGCVDTAIKQVSIDKFDPFAGNDTIIVLGYDYNLSASGGDYYHWSPSDYLSDANVPNPAVHFPSTGQYSYVVDVSSDAGCVGRDTINILVVKDGGVLMPNAFSPNSDGLNDVVKPLLIGFAKLNYFRVFNRWGQIVYETTTVGEGWDGLLKNRPSEQGTYNWVISADKLDGTEDIQKGNLILLR